MSEGKSFHIYYHQIKPQNEILGYVVDDHVLSLLTRHCCVFV